MQDQNTFHQMSESALDEAFDTVDRLETAVSTIWDVAHGRYPLDNVEGHLFYFQSSYSDLLQELAQECLELHHSMSREVYASVLHVLDLIASIEQEVWRMESIGMTNERSKEELVRDVVVDAFRKACQVHYAPIMRFIAHAKTEYAAEWTDRIQTRATPAPLTNRAARVDAVIRAANRNGRAITGPDILDELDNRPDAVDAIELSSLTGRIVPELKTKRGLQNQARVGYYYPECLDANQGDRPETTPGI